MKSPESNGRGAVSPNVGLGRKLGAKGATAAQQIMSDVVSD